MKKISLLLAVIFIFAGAQIIEAAEFRVTQGGRQFSPKKLDIKVGDTIVFVNDDKFTHTTYSRTKKHKFNLGSQKPGVDMKYTFSKAGKIKIRCAIHPKMKLAVNVK